MSQNPPLAERAPSSSTLFLYCPLLNTSGDHASVYNFWVLKQAPFYHLQNSSSKITQLSDFPAVSCLSAQPRKQRFSARVSGTLSWKPWQICEAPVGGPEQHQRWPISSGSGDVSLAGYLSCLHPRDISVHSQCLLAIACCKLVYGFLLGCFKSYLGHTK